MESQMRYLSTVDRLLIQSTLLLKSLNDCNPDIGMEPTYDMLLDQVVKQANVKETEFDRKKLLGYIKKGRSWYQS